MGRRIAGRNEGLRAHKAARKVQRKGCLTLILAVATVLGAVLVAVTR
jgi:hypothetical protein